MAQLIDGKKFANKLCIKLAQHVANLKKENIVPGLAVVRVGNDPASKVYINMKSKKTEEVGMNSLIKLLNENISEDELLNVVNDLNNNEKINGILVQLPLPNQINSDSIINSITPDKDVDGFHAINTGRLWANIDALVPCTPLGCKMLLLDHLKNLSGKKAIIVGRSNIVGKPMAALLLSENCTVTIAHSKTKDLNEEVKKNDIVIAAVGSPEMVKGDWIKPGAVVIDVGINRIEKNGVDKLVGDVDFAAAEKIASAITPVPGGVGPMTIACLLHNTLIATLRKHNLEIPSFI